MKLMGTLLLAAGSFWIWQSRIFIERRKTKALREMVQAVSFMTGEIRCSLTLLPKLVGHCRERYAGDTEAFFASVEKDLKEGISLQNAWEKAVEESYLPEGGAKDALSGLGMAFRYDEEAVLRHLEETHRRMKEEMETRRAAQREKEKLWTVLCASAAGLVWLLVV